tara:strand:+ start:341 stop:517 length:177 start_codon:yes stop_codon:yes gene_type:complete
MANLKLKQDEVGWIKYSLIRTASMLEGRDATVTQKEERLLWDLVDKIEKQEKKQIIKK